MLPKQGSHFLLVASFLGCACPSAAYDSKLVPLPAARVGHVDGVLSSIPGVDGGRDYGVPTGDSNESGLAFTSEQTRREDPMPKGGLHLYKNFFWSWLFIWLVAPFIAGGVAMALWYQFGYPFARSFLPMSVGMMTCAFLGEHASSLPMPMDHYSMAAAMVTVVLVMELSTFEKFITKCGFRIFGTVFGVLIAIVAAELTKFLGHHPAVELGFYFTVAVTNAALAKKYNSIPYFFVMMNITFCLVYAAYALEGWRALFARLFSVFVGGVVALCSVLGFNVFANDVKTMLALVAVLSKAEQGLNSAFAAVDIVCLRNEVRTAIVLKKELRVDPRTVHKEVAELFGLKIGKDAPDIKQLEEISAGFEASYIVGGFSAVKRLEMDAQITAMRGQAESGLMDLNLVRGVMEKVGHTGAPNYAPVVERVHFLCMLSMGLAHGGYVEPEHWQHVSRHIAKVREEVLKAQTKFHVAFRPHLHDAVLETLGFDVPKRVASVIAAMREVSVHLNEARSEVTDAIAAATIPQETPSRTLKMVPGQRSANPASTSTASAGERSKALSVAAASQTFSGNDPDWEWARSRRLGAFIHGIETILAGLGILTVQTLTALGASKEEIEDMQTSLDEVIAGDSGACWGSHHMLHHGFAMDHGGDHDDDD